MFHFHKFGPVQPDGYQYCSKCGRATKPIKSHAPKCNGHVFELVDKFERVSNLTGYVRGMTYVNRCVVCGEMVNHSMSAFS